MTDGPRQLGKLRIVHKSRRDVLLPFDLPRLRLSASPHMVGPDALQVLLADEDDTIARLSPLDLVGDDDNTLAPQLLLVEAVIEDIEAGIAHDLC